MSYIDGTIRANGATNLFLINPSGVVFGANAQLDIGGSFCASTADTLLFEDGSLFSATEPNPPPLLTVNIPIGLQYGSNPGEIRVEGMGHLSCARREPD
ncbi:MAG: S-layer family protein [Symploca sp. SIO2C1]|nr:S-layer family protein [Symploca sp. SIO2C1]